MPRDSSESGDSVPRRLSKGSIGVFEQGASEECNVVPIGRPPLDPIRGKMGEEALKERKIGKENYLRSKKGQIRREAVSRKKDRIQVSRAGGDGEGGGDSESEEDSDEAVEDSACEEMGSDGGEVADEEVEEETRSRRSQFRQKSAFWKILPVSLANKWKCLENLWRILMMIKSKLSSLMGLKIGAPYTATEPNLVTSW
jgi:hypothetical protein